MNKKDRSVYSKNIRTVAILLSILLHFVLMALYTYLPNTHDLFNSDSTPPTSKPKEERLTFDLVETPPGIKEQQPSSETDLASDQSAKAQDNYTKDIETGLPFSDGISEAKNYPLADVQPAPETETENPEQSEKADNENKDSEIPESEIFSQLLKQQEKSLKQKLDSPEPSLKNLDTSASDMGGFSFNTYNWDFAPYMLSMKNRIRSHMNLPYAFTHLGAISGNILVHFTVLPSGVVNNLEILNSDAHYSLEQSSVNAINASSAFQQLPSDFPEDKLEVTARFSFSIIKD
ncbi:MAG: TonB family protein [Candidatus Stygibacter frigidus]|nr:TonB family protein [Candidatus Stygibacter frigidus]